MRLIEQFTIKISYLGFLCLSLNAQADDTVIAAHKAQLLEKFPGAEFTEVEIEMHRGKEVFEYEFRFKGKAYEAFMTRDGKILRLGLD